MVIYNCGVEAGSSIGHKHLQVLPRPGKEDFEMFPDALGIDEGGCHVYWHFRLVLTLVKRRTQSETCHSGMLPRSFHLLQTLQN